MISMILRLTSWLYEILPAILLLKICLYTSMRCSVGMSGYVFSNRGLYSVFLKTGNQNFRLLFDQKPKKRLRLVVIQKTSLASSLLPKGNYILSVRSDGQIKVS